MPRHAGTEPAVGPTMDVFSATTPDSDPLLDVFGTTADHRRYVPRAATEELLDELVRCVRAERRNAVLSGPPGIGKTLLLRVLTRRLEGTRFCVYLPYPAVPAPALLAWALSTLGEAPSYDPAGALIALARRLQDAGEGLVLLIDNAEALSSDAARGLYQAAQDSAGALSLVAAAELSAAEALLEQWPKAQDLALLEPLSQAETVEYVSAYLQPLPPELAARAGFDARVLEELHRTSRGFPGRINAEAGRHVRQRLLGVEARDAPEASSTAAAAPAPRPADEVPGIPPLPPPPAWVLEEEAAERAKQAAQRRRAAVEPPAPGGARAIEQMLQATEVEQLLAPSATEPPAASPPIAAADLPSRPSLPDTSQVARSPAEPKGPPREDPDDSRRSKAGPPQAEQPPAASAPSAAPAEQAAADPGFDRASGLLARTHQEAASTVAATAPSQSSSAQATQPSAAGRGKSHAVARGESHAAVRGETRAAAKPQPAGVARGPGARVASRLRLQDVGWLRPWAIVIVIAFVLGLGSSVLWMNAQQGAPEAPSAAPAAAEPAPVPVPVAAPTPVPAAAPTPVPAAAPTPVPAAPEPIAVHINATPWATIRVDGVEAGVTPLAGVELSPGVHLFEALFPDGRVVEREVEIDAANRFVAFQ